MRAINTQGNLSRVVISPLDQYFFVVVVSSRFDLIVFSLCHWNFVYTEWCTSFNFVSFFLFVEFIRSVGHNECSRSDISASLFSFNMQIMSKQWLLVRRRKKCFPFALTLHLLNFLCIVIRSHSSLLKGIHCLTLTLCAAASSFLHFLFRVLLFTAAFSPGNMISDEFRFVSW